MRLPKIKLPWGHSSKPRPTKTDDSPDPGVEKINEFLRKNQIKGRAESRKGMISIYLGQVSPDERKKIDIFIFEDMPHCAISIYPNTLQ